MPKVSEFLGITILMRFKEHLPPHFHARYAGEESTIEIRTGAERKGRLPPRVKGLVAEWTALHSDELMANWERARRHEPLKRIASLR